jgi:hypothetical protein
MTATAYPLTWPEMFPRSRTRKKSAFRTSLAGALENVSKSLEAFGRESGKRVSDIILSSNVSLGNNKPADPGIAVWFSWDGMTICIPVDCYEKPEENLQAIHHILEARRTELRHGTLQLVKATMTGFKALPPPPGSKPKRPWWEVLDFPTGTNPTREGIEARYKMLAKERHPDAGGTQEAMAELNAAKVEALKL